MNHIFVFGSNTEGRHGKGAALTAKQKYGAIYGQAEGLQGRSYAIITKELRPWKRPITLFDIRQSILRFIHFAILHPELTFQVTKIGCGLAGFKEKEIAPLFKDSPKNVILPYGWTKS